MKYVLCLIVGIVLAQASDYAANEVINVEQRKCYPIWTKGDKAKYQECMESQTGLNLLQKVLGFNVMYKGRELIFGY